MKLVSFHFCHEAAIEFADRYNTALVCHRWNHLACHPRLWLRVDRSVKDSSEPGVFPSIETAVSAARSLKLKSLLLLYNIGVFHMGVDNDHCFGSYRPGDTILVAAGGSHHVSNIQIKKPLCLVSPVTLFFLILCGRITNLHLVAYQKK